MSDVRTPYAVFTSAVVEAYPQNDRRYIKVPTSEHSKCVGLSAGCHSIVTIDSQVVMGPMEGTSVARYWDVLSIDTSEAPIIIIVRGPTLVESVYQHSERKGSMTTTIQKALGLPITKDVGVSVYLPIRDGSGLLSIGLGVIQEKEIHSGDLVVSSGDGDEEPTRWCVTNALPANHVHSDEDWLIVEGPLDMAEALHHAAEVIKAPVGSPDQISTHSVMVLPYEKCKRLKDRMLVWIKAGIINHVGVATGTVIWLPEFINGTYVPSAWTVLDTGKYEDDPDVGLDDDEIVRLVVYPCLGTQKDIVIEGNKPVAEKTGDPTPDEAIAWARIREATLDELRERKDHLIELADGQEFLINTSKEAGVMDIADMTRASMNASQAMHVYALRLAAGEIDTAIKHLQIETGRQCTPEVPEG